MPIDPAAGNAMANQIAGHLKNVQDTLDKALLGTDQAKDLGAEGVLGILDQSGNKDALVATIGQDNFSKLENQVTLLNADMRDGAADQGGNAEAFKSDMATLVSMLNDAGIQVDTSSGQGHYDASTVIANKTGFNVSSNVASAAIDSAGATYSAAIGSMNNTLAGTDQYSQGVQNASAAMSQLTLVAQNWANGANLTSDQKNSFMASLADVNAASTAFQANPTQSQAFTEKYNALIQTMQGMGYTGQNYLQ